MPYTPTAWQDNVTPLDAANLNNMETGISKAPYGPDASANFLPVWNGSAWVYQGIKNAQVDAAAAIAYSKLNLALSIVNGDIAAGAGIAKTKLAALNIADADVAAGAAIALSKLAGYPSDATKFPRGDGTWVALAPYRKTTAKAVNTTTAETDLLNGEITIAANPGTSAVIRLTAWGDWKQNSGGTAAAPRLKAKLGATTLFDTGALVTVSNAATRWGWKVVVEIQNLGAANSQLANMTFGLAMPDVAAKDYGVLAFTTGEGTIHWVSQGVASQGFSGGEAFTTAAEDTTTSKALVLSVINGSNSANYETKLLGALVEVV